MQVEDTLQLLRLRHKEQIMVLIRIDNYSIFTMKTRSVSPWRTLQAFILSKHFKTIEKFRCITLYGAFSQF